MNREELNARLQQLDLAIKQTNVDINQKVANLNMLEGGRQECIYWLDKMDFGEKENVQED